MTHKRRRTGRRTVKNRKTRIRRNIIKKKKEENVWWEFRNQVIHKLTKLGRKKSHPNL